MNKLIVKTVVGMMLSAIYFSVLAGGPDMDLVIESGLYLGVGASWNSIQTSNSANLNFASSAAVTYSIFDSFKTNANRLAPTIDIGYWNPLNDNLLWGVSINYKLISSVSYGEETILPNASAIVESPVQIKNNVKHELLLLAYLGKLFHRSYLYVGLGGSMFSLTQTFIFNPLSIAQGLSARYSAANKFPKNNSLWGWAVQLGYNYYIDPKWFFSLSYTIAQSGIRPMVNSTATNLAIFGNSPIAGVNELFNSFATKMRITAQEFKISANKIF